VAEFSGTTAELIRMAEWLKTRHVQAVAMESTGVYWIAPHEILEAQGLEVLLVDTRQLARVPGRDQKNDPPTANGSSDSTVADCSGARSGHQRRLHATHAGARPATLVAESGDWLRRMQKSLDQMNVRVHRAVSDIDGSTGMAIVRAMVAGERDVKKLAQFRDPHCRQSEEQIAEQLRGHWREELVQFAASAEEVRCD
jgi:hypothetical protein